MVERRKLSVPDSRDPHRQGAAVRTCVYGGARIWYMGQAWTESVFPCMDRDLASKLHAASVVSTYFGIVQANYKYLY